MLSVHCDVKQGRESTRNSLGATVSECSISFVQFSGRLVFLKINMGWLDLACDDSFFLDVIHDDAVA